MGDYTKRLSEVSLTLSTAKSGSLALRTKLKAISHNLGTPAGSEFVSMTHPSRDLGGPSGPAVTGRKTGSNLTTAHEAYRVLVQHMTEAQFQGMDKDTLAYHAKLAGGRYDAGMTRSALVWELRCIAPSLVVGEDNDGGGNGNGDGNGDGPANDEWEDVLETEKDFIDVGLNDMVDADDPNFARHNEEFLNTGAEISSDPAST